MPTGGASTEVVDTIITLVHVEVINHIITTMRTNTKILPTIPTTTEVKATVEVTVTAEVKITAEVEALPTDQLEGIQMLPIWVGMFQGGRII
jgi:Mn-containing catalase